jgi:hypothetical protein
MARTLFVGDVHGCATELEELLDRLAVGSADALFFVGDLVARGPDSGRVVRCARRMGARSVLGNHDARVVGGWRARERGKRGPPLGPDHERVLAELEAEDLAWLAALPHWLDVAAHGVTIVHAGVLPGVPIEQQPPDLLLRLRSIAADGSALTDGSGTLWGALYVGPPHVVFGHHARAGLQLHAHATGLDTGCVYGRELTALVLDEGAPVPPVAERARALVSVRAKRQYFVPG